MCRAVDELYAKHIVKGIASVPVGAIAQAKRKDFDIATLLIIGIARFALFQG